MPRCPASAGLASPKTRARIIGTVSNLFILPSFGFRLPGHRSSRSVPRAGAGPGHCKAVANVSRQTFPDSLGTCLAAMRPTMGGTSPPPGAVDRLESVEPGSVRGALALPVLPALRACGPAVRSSWTESWTVRHGADRDPFHRHPEAGLGAPGACCGAEGYGRKARGARTRGSQSTTLSEPDLRIFFGPCLSVPGEELGRRREGMAKGGRGQSLPAPLHRQRNGEKPHPGRSSTTIPKPAGGKGKANHLPAGFQPLPRLFPPGGLEGPRPPGCGP